MAEEARNEPTMEEILASIRKIISEDDRQEAPAEPAPDLLPESESAAWQDETYSGAMDHEAGTSGGGLPDDEITLGQASATDAAPVLDDLTGDFDQPWATRDGSVPADHDTATVHAADFGRRDTVDATPSEPQPEPDPFAAPEPASFTAPPPDPVARGCHGRRTECASGAGGGIRPARTRDEHQR